jgi:hypothetical protein
MRIIITGGSGLIGQALVAELAADQHEVIILSRSPEKVRGLPSTARAEKWDGRSAQGWGHLADGAEAIVNLAGESIAGGNLVEIILGRWTHARKQAILNSRLNAGRAVVEAVQAASRKPGVVIQSSAVGYYGDSGDTELTEEKPAGSDFLARVCVDWEKSTEAAEAMGVRRAVIRTGVVLSRRGGVLPLFALPFQMFAGGPLGSGRQWFPWIHVDDEVNAIRFLIEKSEARGAYNLAAPNPMRNADFGKVLGRVMRRPSFMPAPAFALRLALGEIADALLLTSQRQLPARLQQAGFSFKYPEAEGALRDLLR